MGLEQLRVHWAELHPVDKLGSLITLIGGVLIIFNWKSVMDALFVVLLNIIVHIVIILIVVAILIGMGLVIGYMCRRW